MLKKWIGYISNTILIAALASFGLFCLLTPVWVLWQLHWAAGFGLLVLYLAVIGATYAETASSRKGLAR